MPAPNSPLSKGDAHKANTLALARCQGHIKKADKDLDGHLALTEKLYRRAQQEVTYLRRLINAGHGGERTQALYLKRCAERARLANLLGVAQTLRIEPTATHENRHSRPEK